MQQHNRPSGAFVDVMLRQASKRAEPRREPPRSHDSFIRFDHGSPTLDVPKLNGAFDFSLAFFDGSANSSLALMWRRYLVTPVGLAATSGLL
jgi:hypothetical protein